MPTARPDLGGSQRGRSTRTPPRKVLAERGCSRGPVPTGNCRPVGGGHRYAARRITAVRGSIAAGGEMAELAVSVATDIDGCREHLDEDGYVVMRGVVSADRLAQLNEALDADYELAR